jgi:hypothetical protein
MRYSDEYQESSVPMDRLTTVANAAAEAVDSQSLPGDRGVILMFDDDDRVGMATCGIPDDMVLVRMLIRCAQVIAERSGFDVAVHEISQN